MYIHILREAFIAAANYIGNNKSLQSVGEAICATA